MLYINYFEYASVITIIIVIGMFLSRISLVTKSSRFFFSLCIVGVLVCISDIVSSYTISFPYNYPLAINYFFSSLYTFTYISSILILLLYVDSLSKINILYPILHRIIYIIFAIEIILHISTPWTHLVIYFDENRNYLHGPILYVNYGIAFLALIAIFIITIKSRVRFSLYQKASLFVTSIGIIVAVIVQYFFSQLLLGGFVVCTGALALYNIFENSGQFYYGISRCQNASGFSNVIKYRIKTNAFPSIIVATIDNFDEITNTFNNTEKENLIQHIADSISVSFKGKSFLLDRSTFCVLVDKPSSANDNLDIEMNVENEIKRLFNNTIVLPEHSVNINPSTFIIPSKFQFNDFDEVESVIRLLSDSSNKNDQKLDSYERVADAIKQRQRLEEVKKAVDKAICNESFQVYYQPIYSVTDNSFYSSEALVRLIDDEIGFIPPDEFIPIAEQAGQIILLGEIVFKKVVKFLKENDYKSLGIKYIEVNVSPIQCKKPETLNRLYDILEESGVSSDAINLEITETAESDLNTGSPIVQNILALNEKGITFSLDDFGSGFAAMDHLFQIPVKLVKVDKSILWQAMENENAMIVLKNTLKMISELKKQILVEGVETQEMVELLIANGCQYMQGYFYSKPLPEAEYIEFLKSNN